MLRKGKYVIHYCAVLLLVLSSSRSQAGTCISLADGAWGSAATWSCGRVPIGGDTVIIQAGHTVSLSNNWVYNGAPLHIQVYGTWFFIGGGSKITLPCGSHVEIMVGGLLKPNSNSGGHSETVRICNVTYWSYTDGPQTGYQVWPPIVLPIELISFKGTSTKYGVELEWSTATEQNSDRFEVYISSDGVAEEYLFAAPAAGFSSSTIEYDHMDEGRAPGLWYYRLVQFDLDGSIHPQRTIAVWVENDPEKISCMPNPVREGHLLVMLRTEVDEEIRVSICSVEGIKAMEPYVLWQGTGMIALDVSALAPGYYAALPFIQQESLGTCVFVVQ